MKKLISLLLIFSGLTAIFTGCADEASSVSESSGEIQRASRVSSSPIDPKIIGRWENESIGYIFDEDRKVSLIMDFSDMDIHFTSDGEFNKAGEIIGKDNITYDGKNLMVQYTGGEDISVIVNMERKDAENPDSFDGVYNLHGGMLIQYFAEMVGLTFEDALNDENITFEAEVKGENFVVTLENYCDYETLGNSLEMFSPYMNYVDESASAVKYSYKIDGDTLSLEYIDVEDTFTETYKKVEKTSTGE